MKEITGDMKIAEVLKLDKKLSEVFMGFGMFCIFCHLGEAETIAQACEVHEVDLPLLLQKLNDQYTEDQNGKKKKTK